MNYANHILHTDIEPVEIIGRINEKTLDIRAMEAELDPTWKREEHVGGFVCHVANDKTQRWNITSNESNRAVRIRLHKDGWWRDRNGNRFRLSDKPVKFYDHNF